MVKHLNFPHIVDSDADPLDGRTEDFFSFESHVFDAGVTNGVGDRVWLDTDGNGLQDDAEPGAAGVTVRLFYGAGTEAGSVIVMDAACKRFAPFTTTSHSPMSSGPG